MGAAVEKNEMRGIETMTVQVPWKAILRFSIPLFIGSLFQQIYSMADAVIVGRLVGLKELAGVGATGAMSFLVIGFATGITSGFSVVIAQRAGAGDKEQIRISVAACGWLCAAVTAAVTLLSTAGADPLLRLMNTPEDIFQYASGYIGIIFGGLGASIYYNMTAGILRAVGDSRTPLYFLIFPLSSTWSWIWRRCWRSMEAWRGRLRPRCWPSWFPRSSATGTHGGNIRISGRNEGTGAKAFPRAGSI